jgi:hypothetical protein
MGGFGGGRHRRTGGIRNRDMIGFEPFVDGLDGVVDGGLNNGEIKENDWAGTRRGRCD